MAETRPRIVVLGEEVPWDEVGGVGAVELIDYFKPVKLSARAIDQASKLVPVDVWRKDGLYTWLQKAADFVFKKLPAGKTETLCGKLRYTFEYDADGPVLKGVKL